MGILDRISTVVKSNLNDLVSKAEDPEKILNQAIEDMHADLKKGKVQVVESLAMHKQMELKLSRLRESSASWERKAVSALQAGDEGLARQALEQKNAEDQSIQSYEASLSTQSEHVGALKSSLAMLETKIDEAKHQRDVLVQRLRQAQVAKKRADQIAAAQPGKDALGQTSAFDDFDRMADKIEMLESHVEAQRELMADDLQAAAADDKLQDLSIDAQLQALKAKNGAGDKAATSEPAPEAEADPIEDELAALKRRLTSE